MKPFISFFALVLLISIHCANVFGQTVVSKNSKSENQDENYIPKFSNPHVILENSVIYEDPNDPYIGIGTTTPSRTLDVNGNIALKDNLVFSNNGSITIGTDIEGESSRFEFHLKDVSSAYHSVLTLLGDKFVGVGTVDPQYTLHVKGQLKVEDPNGFPTIFTSEHGRVGIGNTNPRTTLDVSGGITLNNMLEFSSSGSIISWTDGALNFYKDASQIMVMAENENIGIGCEEPSEKLQVAGNTLTDGFIMPTGAIEGGILTCNSLGVSNWIDQDMLDDGDWVINGTNLFYNTGNVGIGVIEPEATLDIDGTIRISSLTELSGDYKLVFSNSDGELFNDNIPLYDNMGNHFMEQDLITGNNWIRNDAESEDGIFIDDAGNVGIGTNQPTGKLDLSMGSGKKIQFLASESNTGEVWIVGEDNAFGMVLEDSGLGKLMMSEGATASSVINFYSNGKIGIGNTTPATGTSHRLFVEGGLTSEEVVINGLDKNGNWPDYVFQSDYELMSVSELADYIKNNDHLPGIPTAEDVLLDGMNVYEMNRLLLEKIEELTLYLIKQQEEIDNIKKNLK